MFHMLRRQMLRRYRKPLIVMTPKSLLRSKAASSNLALVSEGKFQLVIDDQDVPNKLAVQRVVLCSGKVYYDLAEVREREAVQDVALVRIEQLYPFPHDEVIKALGQYPSDTEVTWCQEEPQNQGAWYCTKHNIEACVGEKQVLYYAGRPSAASPAVGQHAVHLHEQETLVNLALHRGHGQQQEPQASRAVSRAAHNE